MFPSPAPPARELLEHDAARAPDGPQAEGRDEQRGVRLGVLLEMVGQSSSGVLAALDPECRYVTDSHVLIERASDPQRGAPAGYEGPLDAQQRQALHEALHALARLVGTISEPGHETDFKPVPEPELRVRPPL